MVDRDTQKNCNYFIILRFFFTFHGVEPESQCQEVTFLNLDFRFSKFCFLKTFCKLKYLSFSAADLPSSGTGRQLPPSAPSSCRRNSTSSSWPPSPTSVQNRPRRLVNLLFKNILFALFLIFLPTMILDTWLALKQISLSTGWMVSDLIITICSMLCSFCRKLWTYRYTRYIFLCHDDPCFLLSGPQFNTQSGGPLLRRRARQADPSDLSWRYNCVVGTYYRTQRSGSSPPLLSSALCHLF